MSHNLTDEQLLNAYFQDQTIAPDGKLRPTFSRLVERADKAEAELSRLTALLEDRTALTKFLDGLHRDSGLILMPQTLARFADRLIAYLKGK